MEATFRVVIEGGPVPPYEDRDRVPDRRLRLREERRTTGAAGGLHAELEVPPDGWIFLGQPTGGFRNPTVVGRTSQVYVIVDDVDAHHARAKEAGARIVQDLNDLPFGHRRYGCADPQRHGWYFAQPIGGRANG